MSGNESIVVVGKLSRDPELKFAASGTAVCKLSIPTDRKVGEERKTVWWNVTVFGKAAESAGQNLRKGSVVKVEGVLGVDKETMCPRVFTSGADQTPRSVCELVASQLVYIDNFGGGEKKEKPDAATQDEFPF